MRIMSILGTRPDLIKMSEIIKKFDKHSDHIFVHTGQNYDPQLYDVFFADLGLRKPDHYLAADTVPKILEAVDTVLTTEMPDAVVILGDTNSALAGYAAKRHKIPFFHLEAGNRCYDDNVPEEINRRLLDHIADVNVCYTEHARRNLMQEGLPGAHTFLMGSPMREVITAHADQIEASEILDRLELAPAKYYLVSLHRDENIEIEENFQNVIHAVNVLAESSQSTVVMPLHPRTQKKLDASGYGLHERVLATKPFGWLDYCKLQTNAACVISDSGTLAEESALLGFPAVTMRNAIERPEAIDAGSLLLCQPTATSMMNAISVAEVPRRTSTPAEYMIENCSDRVLGIVLGYTGYVNRYVYHV